MRMTFLISFLGIMIMMVGTGVWANPAMLPEHPGYQMSRALDPVYGLPLANDPGQKPLGQEDAIRKAAAYNDEEALQHHDEKTNIVSTGAGNLPKIKGYLDIQITPPVTEAINPNK